MKYTSLHMLSGKETPFQEFEDEMRGGLNDTLLNFELCECYDGITIHPQMENMECNQALYAVPADQITLRENLLPITTDEGVRKTVY
jgi:hypothetical protein